MATCYISHYSPPPPPPPKAAPSTIRIPSHFISFNPIFVSTFHLIGHFLKHSELDLILEPVHMSEILLETYQHNFPQQYSVLTTTGHIIERILSML